MVIGWFFIMLRNREQAKEESYQVMAAWFPLSGVAASIQM
jgi:hypothetical protein